VAGAHPNENEASMSGKFIVTGGAGFIGSRVVLALVGTAYAGSSSSSSSFSSSNPKQDQSR
jgi:nucleoside-diphosphate-sugar epimerase